MNEMMFQNFLNSKRGTAPRTQEYYELKTRALREFLQKQRISQDKFIQTHLIDFLNQQYKKHSPKGMNHIKAVAKELIKYTYPQDWISRFPNVQALCKAQKVIPKYDSSQMFSTDEVQTIIQKEKDPFWKMVYACQFYGGCRPGEITKLKWSDITFTDEGIYFKVYSAKNNRIFEKFIPSEFSYYFEELKKESLTEYCFSKVNGKPITRHSIYIHLIRHARKIMPNRKINPYLLRHSIATVLYGRAEKGELNEDVVARQLGHSKSMKNVYTHLDIGTLRQNARSIYIKPDLTPEQIDKITKLETELKNIKKAQELQNKLYDLLASAGILGSSNPEEKIRELYAKKLNNNIK